MQYLRSLINIRPYTCVAALAVTVAAALAVSSSGTASARPQGRVHRHARHARAHAASVVPVISGITITGYPLPSTPTVTVTGSGFGQAPRNGVSPVTLTGTGCNADLEETDGLDYGTSNIWLLDASKTAGLFGAMQFGANFTKVDGNCAGVVIESWSSSQVVFTLGNDYRVAKVSMAAKDSVCVEIKGVPGCTTLQ
jgi:hypothetical protein